MDREKRELTSEFLLGLKYPALFTTGRGVLLYGPPGVGKTLLAGAIASEFKLTNQGVRYYSVGSAELISQWAGQTEKQIASLYATANQSQPSWSIVFIDELESLAASRGRAAASTTLNSTVPALLRVVNSPTAAPRVITIGATNLPWELDTAILRRLPLRMFVDLASNRLRLIMFKNAISKWLDWKKGASVQSKGLGFTRLLTALTGPGRQARGKLINAALQRRVVGNDVKSTEAVVDKFLKSSGRSAAPVPGGADALSTFGYSPSDLNSAIHQAQNATALAFLANAMITATQRKSSRLKSDGDKSMARSSTVTAIDPSVRKLLFPGSEPVSVRQIPVSARELKIPASEFFSDELRYVPIGGVAGQPKVTLSQIYISAFKEYKSTIDEAEYMALVMYSINPSAFKAV
jgi:hypothetical protein